MNCEVKLVTQKLGKRQYMVTMQRNEFSDRVFEPSKIADAIEGWSTTNNIERVTIGRGKDFARMYVTTSDLTLTAPMLRKSVIAIHQQLNNEKS